MFTVLLYVLKTNTVFDSYLLLLTEHSDTSLVHHYFCKHCQTLDFISLTWH